MISLDTPHLSLPRPSFVGDVSMFLFRSPVIPCIPPSPFLSSNNTTHFALLRLPQTLSLNTQAANLPSALRRLAPTSAFQRHLVLQVVFSWQGFGPLLFGCRRCVCFASPDCCLLSVLVFKSVKSRPVGSCRRHQHGRVSRSKSGVGVGVGVGSRVLSPAQKINLTWRTAHIIRTPE